jgi:hypothetical protein
MIEYPKMLYKGIYNPEAGLGPLQKIIVGSEVEEKEKSAEGFVSADDLDSLVPDELKPEKPKKKKAKEQDDEKNETE